MPTFAGLPKSKRKYLKGRINGLNPTNAALQAGYAPSSAQNALTRIETPDVKAVFRAMIQRAVPPTDMVKTLTDGLKATRTEYFSHQGEVKDQREHIAWAERREYAKMAAEYAGYISRDEDRNVNLHVMLSPPLDDDPGPGHVQSQGQVQDQVIDVVTEPGK